ncbi:MAG: hypothetical protein QOJ65_2557 [Fimbriimonadaceae bacterium]|jgi:hypothetical protein|nr:hypothetical protein [Fimbriimonadaceae bacterium]
MRGAAVENVGFIELEGPTVSDDSGGFSRRVITDKQVIARVLDAFKSSSRREGGIENLGGYANLPDVITISRRSLFGEQKIRFELPGDATIYDFGPDVAAVYKSLQVRKGS